jgi:predicted nucleic acid-binding protein
MSQLIYVDTNIIMDFLEGRDKRAFIFFKKAINCKYELIISDLVLHELRFQKLDPNLFTIFLGKKLRIVFVKEEHKLRAKEFLSFTHYNDAIHAAVAELENVDKLLTQNIKDFSFLKISTNYDGL